MDDMTENVQRARERFPRGLVQPPGFRFSVDALLLAAWAARNLSRRRGLAGLDLGCGCGAAGLALLLARPDQGLRLTGLDIQPDMAEAARRNVALLGLAERCAIELADVSSYESTTCCDFALANPPYRQPGRGRECPDPLRRAARFETGAGLEGFLLAASRSLKTRAPLYLVYLAERLDHLMIRLAEQGMACKALRLVHGRADAPARLVLAEARPGSGPGIRVEPPLVLYAGTGRDGSGRTFTAEALAFCPHLGCNAGQGDDDAHRRHR